MIWKINTLIKRSQKNLEKKIEEEIRNRVIQKDLAIKEEKRRQMEHDANIEALEQVTEEISKAEIKKIAQEVREEHKIQDRVIQKEFAIKEKKHRQMSQESNFEALIEITEELSKAEIKRIAQEVREKYKSIEWKKWRLLLFGVVTIFGGITIYAIGLSIYHSMLSDRLKIAVSRKDVKEAKVLLESGADANTPATGGYTLLTLAIWAQSSKMPQLLLDNGANVNATNRDRSTALHHATGDLRIMRILIEKGADINSQDNNGNTPLHSAISGKTLKSVDRLLNIGADINLRNNDGNTPLMYAFARCKTLHIKEEQEIIKRILREDGLDFSLTNKQGKRALHLAPHSYGIYELVKEKGGTKGLDRDTIDILDRNIELTSEGLCNEMEMLCDRKAYGYADQIKTIRENILIILNKADIDFSFKDRHSRRHLHGKILHRAIKLNEASVVEKMLEKGADPNTEDPFYKGMSAFFYAVTIANYAYCSSMKWEGASIVKLLLKHGADVNTRNKADVSAYEYAVKHGLDEVARVLIAAGAETPDDGYLAGKKAERFVANANGVVYDEETGLEWYAGPDRNTTWDEANRWVKNLTLEGGGWLMPTRKELKSLYKKGAGSRNMTPLLKTKGSYVWSGETRGGSAAWDFNFYYGKEDWNWRRYGKSNRGFAVRSR